MGAPRITLALLCASLTAGCSHRTELVVFHAASLSRVLSDVAVQFEKENPSVRVRLEPSGSETAIRKITELGMRADLLMVADMSLLDPANGGPQSSLTAPFATNEIVLAHRDHSRFTESVTAANWPEVLLREGVRLGCVNATLAPIGYHTQFVWQLAELGGGYPSAGRDLAMRLNAHCSRQLAPDETELVALLESRAVDYAFVYRTTAEDHHLKIVDLPAEENLARRELAARYAQVSLMLGTRQLRGAPIVYGLAVPANAPHPDLARRFAAFLSSEAGQRALDRAGFGLLTAP